MEEGTPRTTPRELIDSLELVVDGDNGFASWISHQGPDPSVSVSDPANLVLLEDLLAEAYLHLANSKQEDPFKGLCRALLEDVHAVREANGEIQILSLIVLLDQITIALRRRYAMGADLRGALEKLRSDLRTWRDVSPEVGLGGRPLGAVNALFNEAHGKLPPEHVARRAIASTVRPEHVAGELLEVSSVLLTLDVVIHAIPSEGGSTSGDTGTVRPRLPHFRRAALHSSLHMTSGTTLGHLHDDDG